MLCGVPQAAVVLDLIGMDEGLKPNLLCRDDVAADDLALCKVQRSSSRLSRSDGDPLRSSAPAILTD